MIRKDNTIAIDKTNNTVLKNVVAVLLISLLNGLGFAVIFGNISILICELLSSLIVAVFASKMRYNSFVKQFLLIKVISAVVLILTFYGNVSLYGSSYYHGGSDDLYFEDLGRMYMSRNYHWPWEYTYSSNAKGMYWFISLIMRLADKFDGYHTMCFRVMNVNFHIVCGQLLFLIFNAYTDYEINTSKHLFLIYTLFPNALYLSSYVFRDTLVTLILLLSVVLSNEIVRQEEDTSYVRINKISAMVILALLSVFSYWLRTELFVYIIVVVALSFMKNNPLRGKKILLYIFPLLIGLFILYRMGLTDYLTAKVDRYQALRISELTTDTNAIYQRIFRMPVIPFGLIGRMMLGLVTPMPTALIRFYKIFDNGIDFMQIIIAFGTCWQILNLPFLFSELRRLDKFSLMFITFFGSIIISTFTFRHFIMVYPFMFLLITRNKYRQTIENREKMYLASGSALIVLGLAYVMLIL